MRIAPSPRILAVTRAIHEAAARPPSRRHVDVAASHLDIGMRARSVAATVSGESGRHSTCSEVAIGSTAQLRAVMEAGGKH